MNNSPALQINEDKKIGDSSTRIKETYGLDVIKVD